MKSLPCWVEVYKNKEYTAAKKAVIARIGAVLKEVERIEERSIISAIRFKDVGAAIFAEDARNHIIVVIGNNVIIPLVRYRLRVWVVSYNIFAKANNAEEHKPCAIIMSSLLSHAHAWFVIAPAVSSPI